MWGRYGLIHSSDVKSLCIPQKIVMKCFLDASQTNEYHASQLVDSPIDQSKRSIFTVYIIPRVSIRWGVLRITIFELKASSRLISLYRICLALLSLSVRPYYRTSTKTTRPTSQSGALRCVLAHFACLMPRLLFLSSYLLLSFSCFSPAVIYHLPYSWIPSRTP